MSEADQGAVDWKNDASSLAIQAVAQAEELAGKTVKAGADALTRSADQQREFAAKAADKFEDANSNFARDNADKMASLLSFASTAHASAQELQQCLSGLVEGVVRTNLRLAQELFVLESPRELFELQVRFLREYFDTFQRGAEAIISATHRQ